ncbi:alkaline phosphatase [Halomonas urumqiensis]|uniref:Alkaline phosphatase n=1 Tax=Halomonas urumqiensis TaxID=1684789 RepID=A0A2N7UDB2_9GAMM|nr:alkaline phosphatase [Halomonas urumqiensis]PMR78442.1 alkaline phosphatase [Halomonas urumqiensis]PTB03587.1 alkaline phosphatase [Halomonas urumqiensis]GHE20208.1 hypothetical protein GCM10017767_07290 [Halomonas urumqiensis]
MPRLLGTFLLINLVLLIPSWLRFAEISPRWLALEAIFICAVLALLPKGRVVWLRWLVVLTIALAVALGLGDAATHQAFGRSLNLYLDLPLARSVLHLLEGNLGDWVGRAVLLAGLLVLVLAAWWLARGLARLQGIARHGRMVMLASALALVAGGLVSAELAGMRLLPVARTPVIDTLHHQAEQVVETRRAHHEFAVRVADSPSRATAMPGLAGHDVLLIFIESYGVSALFDERYSGVLRPRLDDMATRFEAAGLSVVSGVLESPIRGGQSWLAHASVLSGLTIDNALWYRLMLASDRATLVDDFRATGHRTVSLMPAITTSWPEGQAYGFDEIHAAADIDYAGPPLNWVTMPDQFTLHYLQNTLLDREPGDTPTFAQVALISSHAPWTPILPVLDDWDEVGDGRVFERWTEAGDPPDELWQDIERIRDHYAMSVDYALHASIRWAEDFVDDGTLVILLGDHQSAPLITGDEASGGVPVHVITGDPELLEPFLARGFVAGSVPRNLDKAPGMDKLRGWLHEDFAR